MFEFTSLAQILTSITESLVTLLASMGIFVSLIIQRRVDRLQEIMEEFIDLPYHDEINITGRMFNLIRKYTMQYQLPNRPIKVMLAFTYLTTVIIIFNWLILLYKQYRPPLQSETVMFLISVGAGLFTVLFFLTLLKNTINLAHNHFLVPLIPPPERLRSVSFLSRFINVSLLAIIKQARFSIVMRATRKDELDIFELVLKQELSFDDFFYYFYLEQDDTLQFISFGEVKYEFPPDPITGKPVPMQRNLNVPMGEVRLANARDTVYVGHYYLFPREEKNPLHFMFNFRHEGQFIVPVEKPVIALNHSVIYRFSENRIQLIELKENIPYLEKLLPTIVADGKRRFINCNNAENNATIREVDAGPYPA